MHMGKKRTQPTRRLFVYGTLKRGKPLHSWLDESRFIGDDSVYGEMYTLGWYPAFFWPKDRPGEIIGEVYDLPKETFERLRRMEEAAGYKTEETKTVRGKYVHIFVHTNENFRQPSRYITNF